MGEPLARNEIFLFAANLLQKMKFLPAINHQVPSMDNYSINLTKIPSDFYVKIETV